ncbi:MAG: hypothetical protein ACYC77_07395 [Coriobacteriia bacterium]
MSECKLRAASGQPDVPCDGESCTYWRIVDHLDLGVQPAEGCAIQFFDLLEGGDSAKIEWLLSVKERVDRLGH